MKNKCFSHVMACVCGLVLSVASCEKMTVSKEDAGNGGEANVHLCISGFEQTPFSVTRAAVSDVCSRISFLIYDNNGTRIRKEDQQMGDEDFGQAGFMLAQGHYFLVVTAHSGEGNPTSTNAQKIGFTNKTGYTDTFLYADSLTVGDTDVERSLTLKRIVAMVRFIPYDAVPAQADSIRFYYTGGSGTFDAVAGGWGVVDSKQTQWYGLTHSEKHFDIYTIPHVGDDDQLKVTVNTYRSDKNDIAIVSECEIEGIPVKRNHITTCRGYLFSPVYQQSFDITVDDVWDNDSIDFYF
ncbi:MAG: hypothetical protein IJQ13_06905 [Prevotella sp.]|nr:hypothetical protein [Prevotella sp.]